MNKKKIKICIILGTRPEIIKMSPVIRECQKRKINFFVIHTGQHYSYNMDKIFFMDLNLPLPKYNLEIGSGLQGEQTAKMIIGIEKILIKEKPSVVLVQGDTNSVLAGAISASKLHITLGHIEAGLRSYDKNMPEEINRIISDHISDLLFVPTLVAKNNLIKEGIDYNKIILTGNTIVDSVFQNIKIAEKKSNILNNLKLSKNNFFLLTIHRAENTDNKHRLLNIFKGIEKVLKKYNKFLIWPIHPRTKLKIEKYKISNFIYKYNNFKIIEPLGFLDFLMLEKNALLIMTDSGGVQEEACILNTPCVTLRDNTERPETIRVGANFIAGINPVKILKGVKKMVNTKKNWENPFGDGLASKKIIDIIFRTKN